jgi:hypothetical protein
MDTKQYGPINGLHGGNYPEDGNKNSSRKPIFFNVAQNASGTSFSARIWGLLPIS